ncbi:MAG: hypothetical protein ACRDT2_08255 [Natronosporangium sp.]
MLVALLRLARAPMSGSGPDAAPRGFSILERHARPRSLCQARLAGLHLHAGDLDQATQHTRQALDAVTIVRSARLIHAIAQLRSSITEHPDQTELQTLVDEIDTGIGAPPSEPGSDSSPRTDAG